MADGTSDAVENATLEGPAAAWLAQRAEALDVTTAELLERVVAAYRAAEEGEVPDVVTEAEFEERLAAVESEFQSELSAVTGEPDAALADIEAELADLQADVADLESDVAAVDSEFTDMIQDVRERVIQVKRETDAKAPADHDHHDLAEQAADALDALDDLEAAVADLASAHRRLSNRVDAGFENFEEVLTYLRDQTDDLDRKLTTLATAVLAMRESVASVAAVHARRERTDSLKRTANREHVQVADCEDCDSEVTVSLLTAPECPYCGATFEDVEANQGWFGSHTLVTGSAPALTAGESDLGDEDAWLGADTATLEEMASDDGDDDGPEIVEPSEIEDPDPAAGGDEATDGARRSGDRQADASDDERTVETGNDTTDNDAMGNDTTDNDAMGNDTTDNDTADLDGSDLEFDEEDLDLGGEEFDLDDEELSLDETEFDFGGAAGDVPEDDGETDA